MKAARLAVPCCSCGRSGSMRPSTRYGAALSRHPDDSKLSAGWGWRSGSRRGRPPRRLCGARSRSIPTSSDLRGLLHDVLRRLGDDEEDERQLRAGLAREADSPSLLAPLAQSLIAQGRLDEGLACCRAALKVDPDHQNARLARGRVNFLAGRYAAARPDRYPHHLDDGRHDWSGVDVDIALMHMHLLQPTVPQAAPAGADGPLVHNSRPRWPDS